jgi:N-acetylneuraminic acid mutarotase
MASSTVVDNQIYLFGGYEIRGYNYIIGFNVNKKSIARLNVHLPKGAYDIASATIGKKVYLFGGYRWEGSSDYRDNVLNTINVFDIDT